MSNHVERRVGAAVFVVFVTATLLWCWNVPPALLYITCITVDLLALLYVTWLVINYVVDDERKPE